MRVYTNLTYFTSDKGQHIPVAVVGGGRTNGGRKRGLYPDV